MSYSVFEKSLPDIVDEGLAEFMAETEAVLAALASAGVIVVISSGDEGSGGCEPLSRGKRNEMAPQWPSTSAHALSVGGTMWAPPDWNGAAITPSSSYVPGAQLVPVAWRNWGLGSDCLWTEEDDSDEDNIVPAVTWPGIGTTGGESGYVTRP
jgi:subtilase family serine protease